jgi:RNA polymerase sigma-70 factor (ECF subfamily)
MKVDAESEFRLAVDQLLRDARAGSAEALGTLLEHSRRYLLAVATDELASYLVAKSDPSDQVQDTLAEAVQLFVRFTGDSAEELRQWLVAILRNKLANFRKRYLGTEKRQLRRERPLDDPNAVRDGTPSPSSVVSAREQETVLLRAMQRLPVRSRQVIQWRHWENLPYADIGQRLGCSPDAARMIWARAIERLQHEMISDEGE